MTPTEIFPPKVERVAPNALEPRARVRRTEQRVGDNAFHLIRP